MATSNSPNEALIKALAPAKPLPYDPALMQAWADDFSREWAKLETLRREVYRHVMPTIWTEVLGAERAGDIDQVNSIQKRADRRWQDSMGVPPLTSFSNRDIVMATVAQAGFPATEAGLHAWTIARMPKPSSAPTTNLQKAILAALNGQALKTQPLADKVCAGEKSRLYRPGGIKELKEARRVVLAKGIGYYRPDAPPPSS